MLGPILPRGSEGGDLLAASVNEVLGCTINHVGIMFHRARVRLRACLEQRGWDDHKMTGKEMSTFVSTGAVERASFAERMAVWLHLTMCRHCRAFRRQMDVIGRLARRIAGEYEREPPSAFEVRLHGSAAFLIVCP